MKKTSIVLALAVSISGVSPLLANEIEQQTNQNVVEITQPDQESKSQSKATQPPTNTNVDWTLPGMQLNDWEYDGSIEGKRILKRYIGKTTDTVYIPSFFNTGGLVPQSTETVLSGIALEGSMIKNVKIVNNITDYEISRWVSFGDTNSDKGRETLGTLKIPDNSVVKSIEFIGGTDGICFDGSIERAKNSDFIDIYGYSAFLASVYGNVNINSYISGTLRTDLKCNQFIDARSVEITASDNKRINPNPLYMQANRIRYGTTSGKWIDINNHYQLNQLLDGMGIKSEMQLKLDANGGNGGIVAQQPVFFLTDDQLNQLQGQNLDAYIKVAFLENPTYYPTLEGRTFLGWEKQPTNTRAVADAFNQTYLAKWSDPAPVPTVTPTQPQQPVVESKPTASVNTANRTTAITLATVALVGCVGLITLRRFK